MSQVSERQTLGRPTHKTDERADKCFPQKGIGDAVCFPFFAGCFLFLLVQADTFLLRSHKIRLYQTHPKNEVLARAQDSTWAGQTCRYIDGCSDNQNIERIRNCSNTFLVLCRDPIVVYYHSSCDISRLCIVKDDQAAHLILSLENLNSWIACCTTAHTI